MSAGPSIFRVFAVIPAAGVSRRMGGPKQLLPVDGKPMLLRTVDHVLGAGLDGLVVVTRTGIADELGLTRRTDLQVVINDDPGTAMIDSVLMGVDRLRSVSGPGPDDGVLVLPGDYPGVEASVIRSCGDAYRSRPGWIIVAAFKGRRGHPLVFPVGLVSEVRALARTGGLDQLLGTRADRVIELDCPEPSVIRDVDTPDDYRSIARD